MNKLATTAAAATIMLTGLTGASTSSGAAGPAAPAPNRSQHVLRLLSEQIESHRLSDNHPAGVDRLRSLATHRIVGYESFSGVFEPKTDRLRFWLAAALKGGLIESYFDLDTTTGSNRFSGRIIHGTGRYRGIQGTIRVRNSESGRTVYVLRYTL
ncbi:hypothetical protein ACT8ZV_11545 [Nocardioides sp. MAHUQ-72]|uniref:hypothetical protein n=1 Tax=unclassified Nocardioides TaxID=2615069 RepID=UPI0036096438